MHNPLLHVKVFYRGDFFDDHGSKIGVPHLSLIYLGNIEQLPTPPHPREKKFRTRFYYIIRMKISFCYIIRMNVLSPCIGPCYHAAYLQIFRSHAFQ